MYIYHYHAIQQRRIGEVANLDGIATLKNPILSMEDYLELKKFILNDTNLGMLPSDPLTICSLTLLFSEG